MSAPRLFVPEIGDAGATLPLSDEESRHVRSRRLVDGEAVVLLDGRGGRALGTLSGRGCTVVVGERTAPVGEPARRVTVILAAAEPARVEWAVEKGTECGAVAFRIAVCERSQPGHVTALATRVPRLVRIAAEAVKQCGRTCVPSIAGPEPLEAIVRGLGMPLVVARPGAPPPAGAIPSELALAIGPEGGFSDTEDALFARLGADAIGLGPRVLRLETATVAALSLLVETS